MRLRDLRLRRNPLSSMPWLLANETAPRPSATELIQSHRARIALQEAERAQLRQDELAAQRSDRNPPDVRIRIWEKLHGLRLPSEDEAIRIYEGVYGPGSYRGYGAKAPQAAPAP